MFTDAVHDQNSDNSLTQSLLDDKMYFYIFFCNSCSILYNLHTLKFVLI